MQISKIFEGDIIIRVGIRDQEQSDLLVEISEFKDRSRPQDQNEN